MNATSFSSSSIWTAAGWTMLHSLWVGAVLGVGAAFARRALKSTGPELRYGIAVLWLAMLALSPALIFVQVYKPGDRQRVSLMPPGDRRSSWMALRATSDLDEKWDKPDALARDRSTQTLTRPQLNAVVAILPWFWLCGSSVTLVILAAGLIGVEQMRRSSQMLDCSDILRHCHAFAKSLGIGRCVTFGICDRLATPVLLGIVRPMILLPPAALCGWSVEQLEMVLLPRTGSPAALGQPGEPAPAICGITVLLSSCGVVVIGLGAARARAML
jgi:BlaR1 peptidase M56